MSREFLDYEELTYSKNNQRCPYMAHYEDIASHSCQTDCEYGEKKGDSDYSQNTAKCYYKAVVKIKCDIHKRKRREFEDPEINDYIDKIIKSEKELKYFADWIYYNKNIDIRDFLKDYIESEDK
jgi:hypothetical protein